MGRVTQKGLQELVKKMEALEKDTTEIAKRAVYEGAAILADEIKARLEGNLIGSEYSTGDLVDSGHTDIDIAISFVEEAARIAPVYYVTGNHEARLSQYDRLRNGLEAAGVSMLEDRAVELERDGEKITLAGLSDPDFTVRGDVFGEVPAMVSTKLESLADTESSYAILLSHRPELFESYASSGIDLVLSGHAHGGQFRLPFIGGLVAPNQGLFPKYDAGLYTESSTQMVVSRGIGNSIIPVRFNNRPEIVVVELFAGQ